MANKYLEKIAGMDAAIGKGMKTVGFAALDGTKAALKFAGRGAAAFGKQVHLAAGGGFKDYAHSSLGIKSPFELSKLSFGGNQKDVKTLREMAVKGSKNKFASRPKLRALDNGGIEKLRKQQRNARMIVGGTTAAGTYGTFKLKEKLNEPKVTTYDYNY